jgi:hypothetical protein
MFQFSDLPELVDDYKRGDVDWEIAYPVLLRLLGEHEVSEVMDRLSPDLSARFDEALRKEFGNEELARSGLWIDNAGGEPPNRNEIVACVRRWIEKQPW